MRLLLMAVAGSRCLGAPVHPPAECARPDCRPLLPECTGADGQSWTEAIAAVASRGSGPVDVVGVLESRTRHRDNHYRMRDAPGSYLYAGYVLPAGLELALREERVVRVSGTLAPYPGGGTIMWMEQVCLVDRPGVWKRWNRRRKNDPRPRLTY